MSLSVVKCQEAAQIYQKDKDAVQNFPNYMTIMVKENKIVAMLKFQHGYWKFKVKKRGDQFNVSIKPKKEKEDLPIDQIDIQSQYKIFKSRGCEDVIPNFSQIRTLYELDRFYHYYFTNNMLDLLYCYVMFLGTVILLGYEQPKTYKYTISDSSAVALIQQITDWYELIRVHYYLKT